MGVINHDRLNAQLPSSANRLLLFKPVLIHHDKTMDIALLAPPASEAWAADFPATSKAHYQDLKHAAFDRRDALTPSSRTLPIRNS